MLKAQSDSLCRFLVFVIISLSLLLLLSCGDDHDPVLSDVSDDGILALNLVPAPKDLPGELGIVTVEVEVTGIGIDQPIKKSVPLDNHQVTLKVPKGNNRAIRIAGKDERGSIQAVIKGYVDVIGGKTVSTTVNWQTTPVGGVIEKLTDLDYKEIDKYNAKELQALVDATINEQGVHPIFIDTDQIVSHIRDTGKNPQSLTLIKPVPVKGKVLSGLEPCSGCGVFINHPPFQVVMTDENGEFEITPGVIPGIWDVSSDSVNIRIQVKSDGTIDPTEITLVRTHGIDVTGIFPSNGPMEGGTVVTLTGKGFRDGAKVVIGGNKAWDVEVKSDNLITAKTPAGEVGEKDVKVIIPDQEEAILKGGGFTYNADVTGIVIDKTTKTGLGEVIVSFDEQADITDEDGWYEVKNVTLGKHTLRVEKSEYYVYHVKNVEVNANRTVFNIQLEPSSKPKVVSVTYKDLEIDRIYGQSDWVKATKNFVIIVEFNESMDEKMKPLVTLQSDGIESPHVQNQGEFQTDRKYAPRSIELSEGMDGTVSVTIAGARDLAGNVMEEDRGRAFRLDATPPKTTDDAPKGEGWSSEPVIVRLAAEDSLSGVRSLFYTVDGIPTEQDYITPIQIPFSEEGEHALQYWGVDRAGNVEVAKSVSIHVDTTPPSAPLIQDAGSVGTRLMFRWEPASDISGIMSYESEVSTTPEFLPFGSIITKQVSGDIHEVIVTADDGITGCATYYARVRAQNGASLWSGWSRPTDGILVDIPSTPVLILNGKVTKLGVPITDALMMRVTLKRMGKEIASLQTELGKEKIPGRYTVTFVDHMNNCAAIVGDIVEVTVVKGHDEIGKATHELSEVDISNHIVEVDVGVR